MRKELTLILLLILSISFTGCTFARDVTIKAKGEDIKTLKVRGGADVHINKKTYLNLFCKNNKEKQK